MKKFIYIDGNNNNESKANIYSSDNLDLQQVDKNIKDLFYQLFNAGKIWFNDGRYYLSHTLEQESMPISLGFEHIAIQQDKNMCESRLDVNTQSEVIRGVSLNIPMIAANMSTVCDSRFCIRLRKLGALGVLHRAMHEDGIIKQVSDVSKECNWVAASVGVGDKQYDLAKKIIKAGANIIFIDIAHGFSLPVFDIAKKIKKNYPSIKVVVGNTINENMMESVNDFADAVKVGIAQGFACETKNTAGCTERQFSAVLKFKEVSKKLGLPIISDGGIKEPADFVKSVAAGANSIMAGQIFARCPESAAFTIHEANGDLVKIYAGMASRWVQDQWKGGLKAGTCPEGGVRYLKIGESADKLLERYSGALRSGITYAGAEDIKSFQDRVKFVRILS